VAAKAFELGSHQDPSGETLTKTLKRALDAADVAQVRAYPDDHDAP
jgi:hypothetical protein